MFRTFIEEKKFRGVEYSLQMHFDAEGELTNEVCAQILQDLREIVAKSPHGVCLSIRSFESNEDQELSTEVMKRILKQNDIYQSILAGWLSEARQASLQSQISAIVNGRAKISSSLARRLLICAKQRRIKIEEEDLQFLKYRANQP